MMKLFTGNLPWEATGQEARSLVEQCWKVLECERVKTCGLVHAEDKRAEGATQHQQHWLHAGSIKVRSASVRARPQPSLRSTVQSPRHGSAEPRPRGCSGLGEPRPALPSF